jgi:hypothetical protein
MTAVVVAAATVVGVGSRAVVDADVSAAVVGAGLVVVTSSAVVWVQAARRKARMP